MPNKILVIKIIPHILRFIYVGIFIYIFLISLIGKEVALLRFVNKKPSRFNKKMK